jgi:hypothetical protein
MEYSPNFILFYFIFGKHKGTPDWTSHWHPQVKLIGRGPANFDHFSPNEKSLLYVKIIFFRSKFGKNSPLEKKNTVPDLRHKIATWLPK